MRGGPLKNTQLWEVTPTHLIYCFKAYADAGQPTDLTVSGEEFIHRYLSYVPFQPRLRFKEPPCLGKGASPFPEALAPWAWEILATEANFHLLPLLRPFSLAIFSS